MPSSGIINKSLWKKKREVVLIGPSTLRACAYTKEEFTQGALGLAQAGQHSGAVKRTAPLENSTIPCTLEDSVVGLLQEQRKLRGWD